MNRKHIKFRNEISLTNQKESVTLFFEKSLKSFDENFFLDIAIGVRENIAPENIKYKIVYVEKNSEEELEQNKEIKDIKEDTYKANFHKIFLKKAIGEMIINRIEISVFPHKETRFYLIANELDDKPKYSKIQQQ